MPWNSNSPNGSLSVKANESKMLENTAYIETTMGNSVAGTNTVNTRDHFWNVGSNVDGRHRFIQSQAFTVGGTATDPVIGTGMDGVIYLKTISGRVQGFYRNTNGIFQFIPAFLTGSASLSSSYINLVSVPANVYGEIYMFKDTINAKTSGQAGFFKSTATVCEAWSYGQRNEGGSSAVYNLRFGNGSDASGLNIRVRTDESPSGTWQYRIFYRAQ